MKYYICCFLLIVSMHSCKVLHPENLNFEKHFGGVGDGNTDNYKAFVALSKYLKNKSNVGIVFNEGVYLIDQYKLLECKSQGSIECLKEFKGNGIKDIIFENLSNVKFVGNNSSIKLKGYYHRSFDYKILGLNFKFSCSNSIVPFYFNGCKKISLSGFKLEGGAQNTTRERDVVEGSGSGIVIWDSDGYRSNDFVIKNVQFNNFICDGVYIASNGYKFLVKDCLFDFNCRQGISIVKGNDFKIEDCNIKNTGQLKIYGNHAPSAGIDIENEFPFPLSNVRIVKCTLINNIGFQVVATNSTNVHIDSCYVVDKMNGHDSGLSSGLGIFCDDSSIKNTVIKGVIQIDISGVDVSKFKSGILIENNYITNSSNYTGILSSDYNTPTIIKDNIIERIDPIFDDGNDDYFPLIRNNNAKILNNLFIYNTNINSKRVYSVIEGVKEFQNNSWYFPNITNNEILNERINNLVIPKLASSYDYILNDNVKILLNGDTTSSKTKNRSKQNQDEIEAKISLYKKLKRKYD